MEQHDLDLAAAVRAGDEQAFERLFRSYYAPLCTFARRYLGAPESAEEVVQDVFLEIWARRSSWEVRESVRAYLYRSVRNRALNALDRSRVVGKFRRLLSGTEPLAAPDPPAESESQVDELRSALAALIGELPPRTRLAVTLRYYDGLSYREIAATMGISPKGVERLLGIALQKLRARLPRPPRPPAM